MKLIKPFSQACENNKQAILNVLKKHLTKSQAVLEVGSGTGQHAVYFSGQLPNIDWHTSDLKENHAGINAWIDAYYKSNKGKNNLHLKMQVRVDFAYLNFAQPAAAAQTASFDVSKLFGNFLFRILFGKLRIWRCRIFFLCFAFPGFSRFSERHAVRESHHVINDR